MCVYGELNSLGILKLQNLDFLSINMHSFDVFSKMQNLKRLNKFRAFTHAWRQ